MWLLLFFDLCILFGMAVVVFLIQPWCGSVKRCLQSSNKPTYKENRYLKKWALHARGRTFRSQTFGAASPEALEQFLGCQGHIHAVALCGTFEQIAHRGLLHTKEQRVLADYMLFSRHRCLEEVLCTKVLELWTLDEPVPFASVLHGGSLGQGQRQDVVHVDGNWVGERNTMVTNVLGQRVHLAATTGIGILFRIPADNMVAQARPSGRCFGLQRSIILCGHLRGDSSLAPAVNDVGALLGFQDGWLEQSAGVLPSRSTLQRHRFTVDAALCLCVRDNIEAAVLIT